MNWSDPTLIAWVGIGVQFLAAVGTLVAVWVAIWIARHTDEQQIQQQKTSFEPLLVVTADDFFSSKECPFPFPEDFTVKMEEYEKKMERLSITVKNIGSGPAIDISVNVKPVGWKGCARYYISWYFPSGLMITLLPQESIELGCHLSIFPMRNASAEEGNPFDEYYELRLNCNDRFGNSCYSHFIQGQELWWQWADFPNQKTQRI